MKYIYSLCILFLLHKATYAQTVDVFGQCMSGTITLNPIGNVNGRPAYQGTGTVSATPGVTVSMYWLDSPDFTWVLDFDGQPYYQNSCNTTEPPGTGNSSCPWDVVSGMSCTGASPLSITGSGLLPVRFTLFTASQQQHQVELDWKTAVEINNKGFVVERSQEGRNWVPLGFVSGAVNTSVEKSYVFMDPAPFNGKNYYRLVQIDLDGRKNYSAVVDIDISQAGFYRLLHNTGTGLFQVTILCDQPVELSVSDLSGRKLLDKKCLQGTHLLDLSPFSSGVYLLQIKRDHQIITEKLIKQ